VRRPRPSSQTLSGLLLRPHALVHRPAEILVAAACILALLLVFWADILTSKQVALSALGLIPLTASMWLLSNRFALAVGVVAATQLLLTGALGTLTWPTVASEGAAYLVLALVSRLYADKLAGGDAMRARQAGPGEAPFGHLAPTVAGKPARAMETLTAREQQVTRLTAQGYTAREIGDELHIGRRTVETHLVNAYDKLGVRSKRELIRFVSGSGAWRANQ